MMKVNVSKLRGRVEVFDGMDDAVTVTIDDDAVVRVWHGRVLLVIWQAHCRSCDSQAICEETEVHNG